MDTKVVKIKGEDVNLLDLQEVRELLDEARKEEKMKLYGKIGSLEAQIKVLEDEKVAMGTLTKKQEEELKSLREELGVAKEQMKRVQGEIKVEEEKRKGKGKDKEEAEDRDKGGDVGEVLQGIIEREVGGVRKEYEKLLKELEAVKARLSESEVEVYRKEQLEKYKGRIIPELVPEGLKTKEAVNKAIMDALEVSKGYLMVEVGEGNNRRKVTLREIEDLEKEEEKKKKKEGGEAVVERVPPEKPRGVGEGDLTGKDLLGRIGEMTLEEYNKHRAQILAEVKKQSYVPAGEQTKK